MEIVRSLENLWTRFFLKLDALRLRGGRSPNGVDVCQDEGGGGAAAR